MIAPMSLTAGTRIGSYEIQSALGAGGMGEVYRARDVRLGRDVAIKVLPAAFTVDPDRLARFEREARVLASLNHPNIAAIYGLEETTVKTDGGASVHALVLELIEGETLGFRILRGLTLREALDIARQMAEALDAAHERGIIHRDLKPSNVMVTPAGVVKVLDFGLAKAEETAAQANLSQSPTMTFGATARGVLLGTAPYMSPEQARGFVVDKRCDVWAFGCVLFEMLTTHRAFDGPTLTDTIAAVIEREPDWSKLPASTPSSARELLRRCLAKNPARRMRDAGDIAIDLEGIIADLDRPAETASGRAHVRLWAIAAAIAVVLGLGVTAILLGGRSAASTAPSIGTGVMTRITSDAGLTIEPGISADGRLVAYASNRSGEGNLDVYVQQIAGGASIRLTNDPADDREPDVSPDGSLVAFRSDRNPRGVYVAAALGGGARLVARDGMVPRFSPDGRSIAFWTGGWLAPRSVDSVRRTFIVPTAGGVPMRVGTDLASAGDPVWFPDGQALLVYGRRDITGPNTSFEWWRVPIDGTPSMPIGAYDAFKSNGIRIDLSDTHPYPRAWLHDSVVFSGQHVDADNVGLWRIAVDAKSHRVSGAPMRLTNGTTIDESPATARDGRLVFAAQTSQELLFSMPLDGNAAKPLGGLTHVREDTTPSGRSSVSEDSALMAFPKYDLGAGSLWVRDLRTGQERQLAGTPRTPLNPVISVDGRWVGYTVTIAERGGFSGPGIGYVVETSGGEPRKICDNCEVNLLTRDNRHVIVTEPDRSAFFQIDVQSRERTTLVTGSQRSLDRPMIAPNSRWLTFNSPSAVYLAPVFPDRPATEQDWRKIIDTGRAERTAGMSPDGSVLYLLLERDGFRCLYAMRIDAATGQPRSEPFVVAHFHDAARRWGSTGLGSAVTSKLFLAVLSETTSNIWMTTIASEAGAK
jgi:Tol biopolymer transport system component